MSNVNVSDYLVLSSGSVDVEASVEKFRGALATFLGERETEQGVIAEAVSLVFDKNLGAVIPMPALTGLTLQQLNAQPSNFNVLQQRVQDYLRENSKGDSSAFVIAKGKGGGVKRRSDIPATPAK